MPDEIITKDPIRFRELEHMLYEIIFYGRERRKIVEKEEGLKTGRKGTELCRKKHGLTHYLPFCGGPPFPGKCPRGGKESSRKKALSGDEEQKERNPRRPG